MESPRMRHRFEGLKFRHLMNEEARLQPLERLVESDRVHRTVYTDQEIFDREMENIWEKTWVYCGHETQIKRPGDYVTVQIGRQPMIMVRGTDRQDSRALQPLPASWRATLRQPPGQHRIHLRLLVSRLDVSISTAA